MPSIEDEVWEYWSNEVEVNLPTNRDKAEMAYRILKQNVMLPEGTIVTEINRDYAHGLIEFYCEHATTSEMVHFIANALRNKEVDYD
jgi:uncharacterized protein YhdP